MIKVKNRRAIANLSRKSLRANRLRNIVAVIAIALTATLFTALFTIGGSLLSTVQEQTMRQVGTGAHAGFKLLTQQQFDTLSADPKIRDMSYNILVGLAENPELSETYTEIRWTEEKAAAWSFCTPSSGRLPESGLELATTTTVLEALGVPAELGAAVPLTFTANGVTHSDTFTLCGFWEMDIALGANEAFVSREYCDRVAPVLTVPLYEQDTADPSAMAGGINPSLWFASSWDIDSQMEELKARCGFDENVNSGVNWAYASATVDVQSLLMLAALLLLVLGSGYLIIYNVFYISVSRDIRYYGLLKTIGATGRQLKHIVRRQALMLCLCGIPLGLLLGWLCGYLLAPAVMDSTSFADGYVVAIDPLIFIGAAIFSLLTVWISCIRPCRLAARVSPVEAVRYTGVTAGGKRKEKKSGRVTPLSMAMATLRRERKKALAVILSLSLSMVLLTGTYTLVQGFDMDKFLSHKVVTDFLVTDASVISGTARTPVLDGVTDAALDEIAALPGLESMGSVYMREILHTFSDEAWQRAQEIVAANADVLPHPYVDENLRMLAEDHTVFGAIYGVDEALFEKLEMAKDTPFDKEKFMSGDYVLVSSFWSDGRDRYYDVGDTVTLDFENGASKQYEVLAVGFVPHVLGPRYRLYLDCCFILPSAEYLAQAGDSQPLCTGFDADEAHTPQAEQWIAEYCEKVEPSLAHESRAVYAQSFRTTQTMFTLVGGALSLILGLIGILNFANAMVTSIFARRRELAMLQSVGMTGRQLRQMLRDEGLFYAAVTLLFTLTAGSLLSYFAIELIARDMWYFTYHFTLLPVLCAAPVLLALAVLVPALAYRSLARRSVVERLRESADT